MSMKSNCLKINNVPVHQPWGSLVILCCLVFFTRRACRSHLVGVSISQFLSLFWLFLNYYLKPSAHFQRPVIFEDLRSRLSVTKRVISQLRIIILTGTISRQSFKPGEEGEISSSPSSSDMEHAEIE